MNTMKFVTVVFLLIFCFSGFSQTDFREGYIITNEDDTIHGLVDYRGDTRNAGICEFKKDNNSKLVKYMPEDIKAYRFYEGKLYISSHQFEKFDKGSYFIEFLINGIVDIYFCRILNDDFYFIKKDGEPLAELIHEQEESNIKGKGKVIIERKKYIGYLKFSMSDCPEVYNEIEKLSLGHKSLINLSKKYHDYVCEGDACIIYEKKLPGIRLAATPYAKLSIYKLSYEGGGHYDELKFDNTLSYGYGMMFCIGIPGLNEKLFLELDVMRGNALLNGFYETDVASGHSAYDFKMESKVINTSLALKYIYPVWKIKPTAAIGVDNLFYTDVDMKMTLNRTLSGNVYTSNVTTLPFDNNMMGVFGRIGFDIQLSKKLDLMTYFEYQRNTFWRFHSDILIRMESYNMNFGITYKIN